MTDIEKLREILDHRDFYCEKGLKFSVDEETLDWLVDKATEAERLKKLSLWSIQRLHWLERGFAYTRYQQITGENLEKK